METKRSFSGSPWEKAVGYCRAIRKGNIIAVSGTTSIKDGKIFARGACDDKGQFYMHVKALETLTQTNSLPVNIKFIIEGEEEIGSAHLADFIKQNKALLKADVILISDTAMISIDTPSIDVGVRGLTYIEIEVTGPNRDLHSGVYGGAVANPITILAQMIASLHDENNHITIPGFYDDVIESSAAERAALAKAPFDEEEYKKELGIKALWGEKGYTTNERTGIRPTLEINGIWGGYTGEGSKTVLPSKAHAKISCRLVPNQKSAPMEKLLIDHLYKIAPGYVTVNIMQAIISRRRLRLSLPITDCVFLPSNRARSPVDFSRCTLSILSFSKDFSSSNSIRFIL